MRLRRPRGALPWHLAQLILNPSASPEGTSASLPLPGFGAHGRGCAPLPPHSMPEPVPVESSKDLVYGGHLLAAEDESMLGEGPRFALDGATLTVDFDVQRLAFDRAA